MKKALVVVVAVLIGLYAVAVWVPIDPEEQRPGTRLSGTWVDAPVTDWGFHEPGTHVFVQTRTWYGIPHSITTTSMVFDGHLVIPCGWCNQKRWPRLVAADPAVVVKIGDDLYPFTAVRITDPAVKTRLFGDHSEVPDVELYRMDWRAR